MILNGLWRYRELNTKEWGNAVVPGCNFLDLLNEKKIKDPFYGLNEKDVYWVSEKDWEYQKDFIVDEKLLKNEKITLKCSMLDTICDVFINDILVGQGKNCHIAYEWDIKDFVHLGENNVKVIFYSPVNYVKREYEREKTPFNCNGQNGIVHIRKPQCHFGWDWGPVLPPSGISGDIEIKVYNGALIKDTCIEQEHTHNTVKIKINNEFAILNNSKLYYEIKVYDYKDKQIGTIKKELNSVTSDTFVIENPRLWWTYELNPITKQPLYKVQIFVLDSSGNVLDSVNKRIGLRTIKLDRSHDEHGENFAFILNGERIFVKGANWIPPDSFINRYTKERLNYDLNSAIFSNMNMLRIWGGGYYESDILYDLCDEKGILLWQDFMFACQAYPFFEKNFTYNVLSEVEYNVKRLRHHASLAIWCGNNEIEAMSGNWFYMKKYIEWTEKFFYNILPAHLRKYDEITSYIPGSPCGVAHLEGVNSDNVGDTHLWAVWHGLQPMNYYRKRLTRFCSEYGFESLPDINTIKKFATKQDYSLTSQVFTNHQKCNSGNMKMMYYIASRFRLPKNFEDYIYLSQICQQECIKDATEHWRRNKGRCNGSMYWQMNDCWPVCSWSSMDYYGNYKALQYTSRHFNAPEMVSIEDSKDIISIYVINDTLSEGYYKVEYKIIDVDGAVFTSESKIVCVGKNSNIMPFKIKRKGIIQKDYILVANLYKNNILINRKTFLSKKEKDFKFPKVKCKVDMKVKNDRVIITLSSDKFMRLVRVHSTLDNTPFSDNYFDILPKEKIEITKKINHGVTLEQFRESFSVFSVCDIESKQSLFLDKIEKVKILLKPINLGGYIYNRKTPKNYNINKKQDKK